MSRHFLGGGVFLAAEDLFVRLHCVDRVGRIGFDGIKPRITYIDAIFIHKYYWLLVT